MSGDDDANLRERLRDDPARFGEFVAARRDWLRRMVELRLDPRLRGRVDASDVVQEGCAEAVARLPGWLAERDGEEMPLHLWLRFITGQRLLQLHRLHLGAAMRDPRHEVSLDRATPDASAATLAQAIAESGVLSPSGVAARGELAGRLHAALETMKPEDREVLVLRHFEELPNGDVARVLGLSPPAASQRYLRAARRLKELLAELSGSR